MSRNQPLPPVQRSARSSALGPLPRYRTLTIMVRAALYGYRHPLVQHMVERNRDIDGMKAAGLWPA